MRAAFVLALAAACGGSHAPAGTYHAATAGSATDDSTPVADGRFARGAVEHAIAKEQKALELLDTRITEADASDDGKDPNAPIRRAALHADRVAAAGFVAQLQACLRAPDVCPPSLDEPAIPNDFDLDAREFRGAFAGDASKWPAASAAIEKAACGCRTGACVDWVLADLDRWETNVPAAAQSDDDTRAHVVAARECIWIRLGKRTPAAPRDDAAE